MTRLAGVIDIDDDTTRLFERLLTRAFPSNALEAFLDEQPATQIMDWSTQPVEEPTPLDQYPLIAGSRLLVR